MKLRPSHLTLVALLAVAACIRQAPPPLPTTSSTSTTSTTAPTTTAAPTSTTTPEAAGPAAGGTVVVGMLSEPVTLNPFLEEGTVDERFALGLIGQTLWTGVQDVEAENLTLVPDVVTEIPRLENGGIRLNDDGTMTVRYEIRPEAIWEDGTPITGADFEFTYRVVTNRRLPIRRTIRDAYRSILSRSLVVEEKSFEYTLAQPTLEYEFLFNVILPRHQVEGSDFSRDWDDQPWLSGGPFRLAEWREGELIRVERNDSYWKTDPETGQELPYLEAVEFRVYPDSASLVQAFKARQVEIINPPAQREVLEELQVLEEEGADLQLRSGPVWEHLNFQFGPGRLDRNPDSLTEHRAFRQAVAHLVDREVIARRVLGGLPEPLDSFIPLYWPPASGGAWARYQFDPERARSLLATLADELGRDFQEEPPVVYFTTTDDPERIQVAELLVAMLGEGGIELQVELEDRTVFFADTVADGTWEMGEWAWVAKSGRSGLVDHLRELFWQLPPNGLNFYRWRATGREADGAIRAAEILEDLDDVVDQQVLVELIAEVEQILADDVVIVPLYAEPNPGLVWADEVAGYLHNPTSAADTWNVEFWYRADL